MHCYRVVLDKGIFSHKWVLFKNLCQNVCYVLILVFGLKKKSPVIPVALITIVHKTSYQMKALSGLTWDFIQMAVTVSVHIYTMMNAGFIAEQ